MREERRVRDERRERTVLRLDGNIVVVGKGGYNGWMKFVSVSSAFYVPSGTCRVSWHRHVDSGT